MTYTYDFKYRTQPNPHPPLNPIQTSQGYYPRLNTGVLGELKTYYTKIRYQNPDEVASQGFWYKKGFNLNDDVIAIVLIQRRGLVENRRVLVLSYFATCASYASIMLLKSIIVSIMT